MLCCPEVSRLLEPVTDVTQTYQSVPDDKVHPMQAQREADADAGRAPPAQDEMDPDIIPHDQLRKYIAYAKGNCRPKLQNADYDKIAQVCPCIKCICVHFGPT